MGAGPFETRRGASEVPLSRRALQELDRLAIHELGLPGLVLMENAGRAAAEELSAYLGARPGSRVAIVCGSGNNGGDGFVVARHLALAGVRVELLTTSERSSGDAATMREVARRMPLPMRPMSAAGDVLDQPGQGLELVVDGLLGTGFQGELSADMLAAVRALNSLRGPLRVALDLPSGMDADTGAPRPEAVRAHLTLSFAAPKLGFLAPGAHAWLGRTIVLGIGAPPQLALRVQHLC